MHTLNKFAYRRVRPQLDVLSSLCSQNVSVRLFNRSLGIIRLEKIKHFFFIYVLLFYHPNIICMLIYAFQIQNRKKKTILCDRFEQKQPCGWVLTNPLNATPLSPGSTFIDGFSRAIYQKIADFNSYPLRYQF